MTETKENNKTKENDKTKENNKNSKLIITRAQVKQVTEEACMACNMEEGFFEQLWNAFLQNDDVYKEYVMYLVKRDFPCEVKICGYTIVDILIWQMDGFKTKLDMDTSKTKGNQISMVLLAFDAFMKMRVNPEHYLTHLAEDSGIENPCD